MPDESMVQPGLKFIRHLGLSLKKDPEVAPQHTICYTNFCQSFSTLNLGRYCLSPQVF